MLETVIAFTRYLTALLFGVAVSVSLAGMKGTRKNYLAFSCFIMVFFILQASRILLFGMDFTIKIYPLLSHIPVFFLYYGILKTFLADFHYMRAGFLFMLPASTVDRGSCRPDL